MSCELKGPDMKRTLLCTLLLALPLSAQADEMYSGKYGKYEPKPQHHNVDTTQTHLTVDLHGAIIPPYVHVSPGHYVPPVYTYVTRPTTMFQTYAPVPTGEHSYAMQNMAGNAFAPQIPTDYIHQGNPNPTPLYGYPLPVRPGEAVMTPDKMVIIEHAD